MWCLIIVHELETKKMGVWLERVDKTYYRFLVTSGCLLSRKVWWAVWIGSFWPKNWDILQTRLDQKGDHMKMNFEFFQIQKWILQTVRSEKVDEKNGVICLVSMFPSWVMVLKLSKKMHFLQFCAELSKKSKSSKAIYIYASERSLYALSENGIVYYTMTYCFGDISAWNRRILLNFMLSQHLFWYFNR